MTHILAYLNLFEITKSHVTQMSYQIGLFGATGGTGQQILKQGLEMGYSFRLLCRSAQPPQLADVLASKQASRIELIQGDATVDQSAVDKVIEGCDAVVVTLGGWSDVCSRSQSLINQALSKQQQQKKPQLIVVTSLGVGDSYNDLNWMTWVFVNLVIRRVLRDKAIQEESVKQSGCQRWTIVRPVGLKDGSVTGKYKAEERGIGGGMINRSDVAHFILHECLNNETKWINKAVTISN